MSWSFNAMGKVENVAKALDEQSGKLTGQSKVEFDDALPHMKALLAQNFQNQEGYQQPVIDFEANGSGSAAGDKQLSRQCNVSIKGVYKTLV